MTAVVRFRVHDVVGRAANDSGVPAPAQGLHDRHDRHDRHGCARRRLDRRPAWRLAHRIAALEGLAPPKRWPIRLLPFPNIALERVGEGLGWRPALRMIGLAFAGAVLVHLAFGGWGLALRPHKVRSERIAMAVAESVEELPPDDTAPPPPPPPSSSPSLAAPSALASSVTASSAGPLIPGLSLSAGAGGAGMRLGTSAPLASTSAAAPATPVEPRVEAPRVRLRPAPEYPRRAREQRIEGHVTLHILVDATGAVRDVRVLDASPAGVFDEAALGAARRFTFEPGRVDGKAADAWVRQVVRFALQ